MFNVFRKSHPHQPAAALAQALVGGGGLLSGMDPATLAVVEQRASYSGRRVSYFRVFDPVRVAECGVDIRVYGDLDAHPELVLGSGHVEQDGAVILTRRDPTQPASTLVRSQADRSAHADDEQVVFPDRAS